MSRLVQEDYTLPSGSNFTTSSGLTFVTQKDVVIPASVPCFPTYCAQSASVDVAASQSGTAYNGVTGSAAGPSGATGVYEAATSGGTSVIVKMVTAEDVDRANGELIGRSTKDQESSLADKFANGEVVVTGSFSVSRGAAVSSPAVGEATQDGKATLTIPTTYTIQAVQKADLESYLNNYLKSKLDDSNNQKVYSTGIEEATLSGYKQQGELSYATVNANGSVGPRIDESRVKDQVAGKRYGDVQQSLELIDGIKEVDVQFSHFWVRTVPNNPDKISIEFKIDEQ